MTSHQSGTALDTTLSCFLPRFFHSTNMFLYRYINNSLCFMHFCIFVFAASYSHLVGLTKCEMYFFHPPQSGNRNPVPGETTEKLPPNPLNNSLGFMCLYTDLFSHPINLLHGIILCNRAGFVYSSKYFQ